MRKFRYNKVFIILGMIFTLSACNKDILEKEPLNAFPESAAFTDPNLVETFVNNMYYRLGIPFSITMLANFVDEAHITYGGGANDFNKSNITADRVPHIDGSGEWTDPRTRLLSWGELYKSIRNCNIFFDKISQVDFDGNDAFKNRLVGEVHFLRGYYYHLLTTLYGGVPIIETAYDLSSELSIARDTYADCISFVVSELDQAAALLPVVHESGDYGRATKGAALALKARVLLYAASDLHNDASIADYSELQGYVGGDRVARWQAAKDAAKAVIDLGIYGLVNANPGPGDDISKNYTDVFLSHQTVEDIFIRQFLSNTNEGWDGYHPGLYVGPNGYHNWGNSTPVGELVDDYQMADGSKFDWTNPAHAADPYANREPRFYADILYHGAPWRQRPSDMVDKDPVGIISIGDKGFYTTPGTPSTWQLKEPGLDTRNGPIEDWNGTFTGYYSRKFIDPTINAQYVKQDLPWRFIRYAEVILNYAEACIGLGQDAEAQTYINMIRTRAGLPDVTATGTALVDAYRNERRIELSYEEHRLFDVRRWLIGPNAYKDMHRIDIKYISTDAGATYPAVPTYESVVYDNRAWDDKAYFFPLMRDELNKNPLLVQNPGY